MACGIDSLAPDKLGVQPMGLGALGSGKLIWKRKFRWTLEIEFCCGSDPAKVVAKEFVKVGARPNIQIDEVEINYLNGVTWIPGKGKWQEITVTYYDVAGAAEDAVGRAISTTSVLAWIASVYNIFDPINLQMNSTLESYEGTGRLILWDGCGQPLEGWLLRHMWPKSVNWGELDMESNDMCTIEMSLRYSEVKFQSYCPVDMDTRCDCPPCPAPE